MTPLLKKSIVWSKRQFNHMRQDGLLTVFEKIQKLFWLAFMHIAAPSAILCEMDWPKAYFFIGTKNLRKLKKIKSQLNPSSRVVKNLEDQTIQYFKRIVDQEFSVSGELDWLKANEQLRGLLISQGKSELLHEVCQQDAEFRHQMAKSHQFDSLEIEFLPMYLSKGSIGNYEHLDMYIRAGKLGLRPDKKLILLVDHKESINNPSISFQHLFH